MLKRLHIPLPCNFEDCSNMAYWRFNDSVMCHYHLTQMADMNSDNEVAVYEALVSPGRADRVHETVLSVYGSTTIEALCAVLNSLEAKRRVEIVHHGTDKDELIMGYGFYTIMERARHCHAPIVAMVHEISIFNLAEHINQHSQKIRQCVAREFQEDEEIPANG